MSAAALEDAPLLLRASIRMHVAVASIVAGDVAVAVEV